MAMDQYLFNNPFTSYFDVHQGYKVLTHCQMDYPIFCASKIWESSPWLPPEALHPYGWVPSTEPKDHDVLEKGIERYGNDMEWSEPNMSISDVPKIPMTHFTPVDCGLSLLCWEKMISSTHANWTGGILSIINGNFRIQDPKMEVQYHIRPYFAGIFPYIGLTLGVIYIDIWLVPPI